MPIVRTKRALATRLRPCTILLLAISTNSVTGVAIHPQESWSPVCVPTSGFVEAIRPFSQ